MVLTVWCYLCQVHNCHRAAVTAKLRDKLTFFNAAMGVVEQMVHDKVMPDAVTLSQLVQICKCMAEYDGRMAMMQCDRVFALSEKLRFEPLSDIFAKTYIELCGAAAVNGANPDSCLKNAVRMMQRARERGELNDGTYTCLMDTCSKVASMGSKLALKQAFAILELLVTQGPKPTQIVCNALLDCIAKAVGSRTLKDGMKGAQMVIREMEDIGIDTDIITFNTLLDLSAKQIGVRGRGLDDAVVVVARMHELNIQPDIITYNTLLNACSKAARQGNKFALQATMRILDALEDPNNPVKPNVISYNAAIDACSSSMAVVGDRTQSFELAFAIYKRMTMNGVKPSVITHTALIGAARLQV